MARFEIIVCFAVLALTSASYSGSNYGSQGNYGSSGNAYGSQSNYGSSGNAYGGQSNYGSSGNAYGGNQYKNVGNNDQYKDGLYFNPGNSYVQAYGGSSSYNVPSYPTSSSYGSRYNAYNKPSYSAPAASSYGSGSSYSAPAASSYGSGSSYSAPASSTYGSGSPYSVPAASNYGSGSSYSAPAASSYGSGSSYSAPAASSYGSGSSYSAPAASNYGSGSSYSSDDYSVGTYPCGPKDEGKTYAIVGLCYGYYECYYGESLYRQCNNYYSFDAYSGKCVADNSCSYVAPAVAYGNNNDYSNNGYAAASNNYNNNGYAAANNNGYAAASNNAYSGKSSSGY